MTAAQRAALTEQFDKASPSRKPNPWRWWASAAGSPAAVLAGWVLGVPGERRRCGQRGSRGSLGCRRVLRPGPVRAWPDVIQVACFRARRRRFRCRLLRHRPARGRGDGSAAASAAGSGREALEHAGIAPDGLSGTRAAVMMGVYYSEYQTVSAANPDSIDAYSATGNAHSVTVGRIAYLLGLRGPAVAVDTACSSSLVSVHLACQSLRLRESDLALAGGVNLILRPETQLALSKWGMLSPRGRCHAFDAGADGFVRGEGAGVVVLKRLTDAVRDGDRVLAVVRGSAVNQDGRSNGLTAPNALAQRDVLTRALRGADVAAGSVNYVEAHGTGTALGDPIEFDALADVYGRGDGPCALGAVKTNMGHLEAAAGIAGFIKAVLAVQRAKIPPNLHFSQWNPAIDASATRLFVPTELASWPDCEGPRRAGVSSFGLGGTNAHVVLEQGPDPAPAAVADPAVTTLVVSGKTDQRIAAWASALADWMGRDGTDVPLADVAHTITRHRSRHGKFATVCARDHGEAVAGLRALAAGQPAPGVGGSVRRAARVGHGVRLFRSRFAMARNGPAVAGRRTGVRRRGRRVGAGLRRAGRVFAAAGARRR